MEGAGELGIPRNSDYNGVLQEGISYVQRTTYGRRRVSTARAFLNPAKKRSNLKVLTNAFVTRILLDNKTAHGVEFSKGGRGGRPSKVLAKKEVILSGGTINSPQLLQLSGIGPGALLRSLGVDVVHELAGVGENLRDHYAPRFCGRVKGIETINEQSKGAKILGEIAKYFMGGKSILNLSPSMVYGFWHSDPVAKNNDIQFVFAPASYKLGKHGLLADHPGFTVAAWQHRPDSKGWVRLRSADPFEKPIIQPNYLSAESDRAVTIKAMKLARSLMHTKSMRPYFDGEEYPGAEIESDDELLDALEKVGLRGYEDSQCFTLSAGQQQRVSLSKLLLSRAKLWVLDEPFNHLDDLSIEILNQTFIDHVNNNGMILFASHFDPIISNLETLELN